VAAVPAFGRAARVERPTAPGCDATRDLYERFSAQIFGYCLHQLGSREEAEDAMQTTFMNAFRGLQRGIVPEVESAWLFKIAHNVCLSRRRSTWRRGRVEAPNNLEVLQEVIPAREQLGDELIGLPDVLEQMPESQRRAILLREWQGLSYREIADELRLSQSAVETLIFRARRALAAGLEVKPERPSWRLRARHGVDAGGLLAALKALFTGGTAVKVAATVALATTAAVAVSDGHHRVVQHTRAPATPAPRSQSRAASRAATSIATVVTTSTHPAHPHPAIRRASVMKPAPKRTTPPAAPRSTPLTTEPSQPVAPQPPATGQAGETKKGDATPTTPPAHDNPGKGREMQPVVHDVKSTPQPAPTNDTQSQTEQEGAGNGGGNGEGHGNGHK
jgi:RNA polymerase sigma factor (sigma-70 family)